MNTLGHTHTHTHVYTHTHTHTRIHTHTCELDLLHYVLHLVNVAVDIERDLFEFWHLQARDLGPVKSAQASFKVIAYTGGNVCTEIKGRRTVLLRLFVLSLVLRHTWVRSTLVEVHLD